MKIEQRNSLTIIALDANYSGLDESRLSQTMDQLTREVERQSAPRVLVDFSATEYFGSAFLDMLLLVWKQISQRGGQFAVCAVSDNCLEILRLSRLDSLWSIYPTVEQAIAELSA